MAPAKQSSQGRNQAESTRVLKQRTLTCLQKLADRDTYSAAATELESIAKSLTHDSIPPFISSITATDASDKSPVRKQCVHLISILSETHGDALSPYLCKILSAVVRRLRDPDSTVRSACIDATASISSHLGKPPFTLIIKPLFDALVTEQDQNAQIGAALCLAAAVDASPDPEPLYLKKLLPRLEKLLKCDSFKAKPALLTLIASVIGAGAASSHQVLKNLVPCLEEFIRSENWAARKAAAEALVRLAVVERDILSQFKSSLLKTFEGLRFDKVKVVRETMNQMVEAWKEIPDASSDEFLDPLESQSSSKGYVSDGRYPPGSKLSCIVGSGALQMQKKNIMVNRSSSCNSAIVTPSRKRIPLDSSDKKTASGMFQKLEHKKPTDWKVEIASSRVPSMTAVCEDGKIMGKGEKEINRFTKPETKQVLNKHIDGRVQIHGGFRAGSFGVSCQDEISESTIVVSNATEDFYRNHEAEDLSLIRKQLVQIENQQSSLLDLLQKFIGSSESGMHALETRVHDLELTLDEISFDLAVSTGRMSSMGSGGSTCCKLPGAEFLSSKFWRRTEVPVSSSSRIHTRSVATMHNVASKNGNFETFKMENSRFRLDRSGGFVLNPLAENQSDPPGISVASSFGVSKNGHGAV